MGTRARIGIVHEDGTVTSIYTHWDGYPSHHAPILAKHYVTKMGVLRLMSLGDLSILGAKIGVKHDFNKCPDDTCNAYGRDRGEKDCAARNDASENVFDAMVDDSDEEYAYKFKMDKWMYRARRGDWRFAENVLAGNEP